MANRPDKPPFQHLLVLFDPATGSHPSLVAVTNLAAQLGAELEVLFIADTDLLSLADLSATRQVAAQGSPGGEPSRNELEAAVLAQQRRLRQQASMLASELGVRATFRSIRGGLLSEISSAARTADLLIVERAARPLARVIRIKAPALQAVQDLAHPVLVLGESLPVDCDVQVLVSAGSQDGALITGAHIAAARRTRLQVRISAPTEEGCSSLEAHVERLLSDLRLQVGHRFARADEDLQAAMRSARDGLFVLDWTNERLARHNGWQLIEKADCSVLVLK